MEQEQDMSSGVTPLEKTFLMYDGYEDEWVYVTPEEFAARHLKLWQGERRSSFVS